MKEIEVLNRIYMVEDHWFWKQYNQKTWEPETLEVYEQYLNSETNYIDLGAWLGVTIFYANEIGCKEIYGVEANPLSYELLCKNCKNNSINANLNNLCITNKNKIVSFGSTNNNETSSNSSLHGNTFRIQGVRLRDYLKDKPKENLFIKVDIEGAEELIIDDLRNVKGMIYLSIHVPFLDNRESFLKKLQKFNVLCNDLEKRILTDEEYPEWGTSFGNFFEVIVDNR